MSPVLSTRAASPADLTAISALHAAVFGPGRFARTAYRVREGTPSVSRYCRVMLANDRIIASLRLTAIRIGGEGGALLLGPLAVDGAYTGQGFGRRLVGEALEAAKADGIALVVLVGDLPYYGRLGFKAVPPGQIVFPGPVDRTRLLAAELQDGALTRYRGLVAADTGPAATSS